MKNIAEFQIIGRVGVVEKIGSTMHVTIASNYSYKDEGGEWRDDAHWNEVVVFTTTTIRYIPTDRSTGGEALRLPSSLFRCALYGERFNDSTTSPRARRCTSRALPRASRTTPTSRRASRSRSHATRPPRA